MSTVKRESRPGDTPYNGLKGGGGVHPERSAFEGFRGMKGKGFHWLIYMKG